MRVKTDRELLEAAAKAAGIVGQYCAGDGVCVACIYVNDELDCAYGWNPLTDDGDALRLAVKLNLLDEVVYELMTGCPHDMSDPYAATRRAIVHAAAAMAAP